MHKYLFHFDYIDPSVAVSGGDQSECHIMTWIGTHSLTRHYHAFSQNADAIKLIAKTSRNKIIQHFTLNMCGLPKPIYGIPLSLDDILRLEDDEIFKFLIFNL